ncbi:MAG TPA: 2-oxo acid dehydrogenase subunit E2 [Acidimicrobiia bacterium]|nr:2-oxo acid dehydrogenase subunit E2 [Acidimicrobiia bacterium]
MIVPPQVAMIGFGKVVNEVIVESDVPTVHPVVHATLAADHRRSGGHSGGLFLTTMDRLLQKPVKIKAARPGIVGTRTHVPANGVFQPFLLAGSLVMLAIEPKKGPIHACCRWCR